MQSAVSQEPPFQDNVLSFTHYSYEDGLPFNPGSVIFQDRAGYMWFGSTQGFCRYDGYAFEWIGNNPQPSNSLSNLSVTSFFEDNWERLWIGTGNGLICLDKWREQSDVWVHNSNEPHSLSGNEITSLSQGLNDTLWVGTTQGLNRLDLKTNICERYLLDVTSVERIGALFADDIGAVWFESNCTLYRLDSLSGRYTEIPLEEDTSNTAFRIYDIIRSSSGKLWLARYKGGTTCLDPETMQFTTFKCKSDDPYETHTKLHEDASGILWIATGAGLLRFNPQTETWARETYQRERPNCITSSGIYYAKGDRAGGVWVATNKKLHYYDKSRFLFRMIKHDPNHANSLGANSVFSICEDANGMIWIGLEDQGLNCYDPKTQAYKQYLHDPNDPTSLSSNTVTALCPDSEGQIWVGGPIYRAYAASIPEPGVFADFLSIRMLVIRWMERVSITISFAPSWLRAMGKYGSAQKMGA